MKGEGCRSLAEVVPPEADEASNPGRPSAPEPSQAQQGPLRCVAMATGICNNCINKII